MKQNEERETTGSGNRISMMGIEDVCTSGSTNCSSSEEIFPRDADLDQFVKVAKQAVDLAAVLIRKYYWNPETIEVFNKEDENGCIVEEGTNVDLGAEEVMVSTLLQHFPDHLVYGEERGWRPEKKLADFVWVIDPIDGTTSFKHGSISFGILVALLYKNKPILGIIDQPIIQRRWVGVHGRRTTDGVTDNERSRNTRSCEQLSRAVLYTSSPLHFSDEEKEAFDHVTDKVTEPYYGADCVTYGLLASGSVDLVIQSFLSPYDFLAFIPIIEGAGGIITDWKGRNLYWEASPFSKGPQYYRIIAAGDAEVHQQALEYLNAIDDTS